MMIKKRFGRKIKGKRSRYARDTDFAGWVRKGKKDREYLAEERLATIRLLKKEAFGDMEEVLIAKSCEARKEERKEGKKEERKDISEGAGRK